MDRIIKYPSIPYLEVDESILDNPVYVFEKLDGGNCQLRTRGERLHMATRSGDYSNRTREHQWFGQMQNWANFFYSFYQRETGSLLSELLPNDIVLFGEWLSFHSVQYKPEALDQFYLIDVYDLKKREFVPYEEAVMRATCDGLLPINTMPILHKGKADTDLLEEMLEGSAYYEGHKEGLVVKDYANQRFAKFLHPEYREFVRERAGLDAYLTERRLEKVGMKLKARGLTLNPTTLQRAFMEDLKKEAPSMHMDRKKVSVWLARNAATILNRLKQ